MRCCKCKTENPDEAKFCRRCGEELKNEKHSTKITWGIILSILVVGVLVLFAINNGSNSTTKEIIKVEGSDMESVIYDWSGTIEASSYMGSTAGGTGIVYDISIKLHSIGENEYSGTMEIGGWQAYSKGYIKAYANGKNLKVYYDRSIDGMSLFTEGDALVEFHYNNGQKLTADWFIPMQDLTNEETEITKN